MFRINSDANRISQSDNPVKTPNQSFQGPTFKQRLDAAVKDVNTRQIDSNQAIEDVIGGKMSIHEAMLNLQEADITLRLLLQTRNKVMEAYQSVMRMQF